MNGRSNLKINDSKEFSVFQRKEFLSSNKIDSQGKDSTFDRSEFVTSNKNSSGQTHGQRPQSTTTVKEIIVRTVTCGLSLVIPAVLYNQSIEVVVDSAAQVTVISEGFFQTLGLKPKTLEHVKLRGAATDGIMEAKLVEGISLNIGKRSYRMNMYVAPISDQLILGLDFLLQHKCRIDFDKCTVDVGEDVISATLVKNNEEKHKVSRVTLTRKTVVPPNSVRMTKCFSMLDNNQDYVITSVGDHHGLLIPSMLVQGQSKLSCSILNPTDKFIHLKAGHVIGNAVPSDIVLTAFSGDTVSEKEDTDSSRNSMEVPSLREVQLQENSSNTEIPDHVKELLDRSKDGLDEWSFLQLRDLVVEYADVFSKGDFDLGCFTGIKHRIDTGNAKPIRQRMRRTPLGFQEEEEKHLQNLLDIGIIEPSISEWAAAPVFVRKKDGGVRYCLDYRGLNNVSVKDAYPLPSINECIDTLSGNVYFSALDLACGYYQIEIDEQDRHKTAFITRYGLFEHRRMAFGLTGAPATFQRAMHLVLKGLTWSIVLAYLDDLVLLGKTVQNHLNNLREVFQRFRQYKLKLKPKKCQLFQTEIKFLGKQVSGDGLSVDPDKTKAVSDWPIPRNVRDVESFLGFVNYHRDHIAKFAEISTPLYELTGPKASFEWQEQHQCAFEQLKQMLICAPVLSLPKKEGTFILDCDASDTSIGAELCQIQDGEERTICYGSFVLTPAQRRYCTTRKELLSVVRFTRQFRHYLLGRSILVRTDHNSLTWLMRFKMIEGQLARWLEELAQYDMVIQHRPGRNHVNADSLSRIPDELQACDCYQAGVKLESLPCGGCRYCSRAHTQWSRFESDVDDVVPLAIRAIQIDPQDATCVNWMGFHSKEEVRKAQLEDPDIGKVLTWVENDQQPLNHDLWLSGPEVKSMWLCRNLLVIQQGVLYYKREGDTSRCCLVVPKVMREEVMKYIHDLRTAGHLGQTKSVLRGKEAFFWYKMAKNIVDYVKTCAQCNKNKKPKEWPKAALGRYHAGIPLERIHIDILGPFVRSKKGNLYILMLVDQFSKWLECYALPDQTAESIAEKVVYEFIARFGCPLQVHSDQGRNFDGKLFQAVCDLLQITKTRTTPYRPCSNGQVERYNRLILQTIRCCLRGCQNTWDEDLPLLASAVRSMVNRQTGYTANMLMLGREVTKPVDILFGIKDSLTTPPSMPAYVKQLEERLNRVHQTARENLQTVQARQKRDYDLKLAERTYERGDLVYKVKSSSKIGQSRKLTPVWCGPYLVTEVLSPILYRIKDRKQESVIHHDRLKICEDRFVPMWMRRLRHDLLDLDDTIAHDEDEQDDEGDPVTNVGRLFNDLDVEDTITSTGQPGTDSETDSESSDSDDSSEEENEPKEQRVTRKGRHVNRPAYLRDYQ